MSIWFVLPAMLFMHVFDDYVLQAPCLCNLKQKSFWEKNAPDLLYSKDYLVALIMHGVSWAFSVMLPVAIYKGFNVDINFFLLFAIHAAFHAAVDDLKANKKAINLWQDQGYHMMQILSIFVYYALVEAPSC
jgi:uncharacterized membrane protein YbhN (UPF0104 family)